MRHYTTTFFRIAIILVIAEMASPDFPCRSVTAQEQGKSPETVMTAPGLPFLDNLDKQLTDAREKLAAIPGDTAEDSFAGRNKASLERRILLIEEYNTLLALEKTRAADLKGIPERQTQVQKELKALKESPLPLRPAKPNKDDYSKLNDLVSAQRQQVVDLSSALAGRNKRLEAIPQTVTQTRTRAIEADNLITQIRASINSETDNKEKSILDFRLQSRLLDKHIAQMLLKSADEEIKYIQAMQVILSDELDLAQRKLQALENEFKLYSEAYQAALASEQQAMGEKQALKEREAKTAETPGERLLSKYEAEILHSKMNVNHMKTFHMRLQQDITEQEKRLGTEQSELQGLQEYFQRPEVSSQISERLRLVRKQLRLRREMLGKSLSGPHIDALKTYRARRFEIEDILFSINEEWEQESDAVIDQMPKADQESFALKAQKLHDTYRNTLREEQTLLTEVITDGQKQQIITLDRLKSQSATEAFIRSKAFWLRDGTPLTFALLGSIKTEVANLSNWCLRLISPETRTRLMQPLHSANGIFMGVLLIALLPLVLLYFRRRLRRFVIQQNTKATDSKKFKPSPLLTLVAATTGASLLPVYLLIMAKITTCLNLPERLSPIIVEIIQHLAFFLFFWLLARSFFRQKGIAHVHFGMPENASLSLRKPIFTLLGGYVIFHCAWNILKAPPFEFVALPQLSYTIFGVISGAAVARIIWPRSPIASYALQSMNSSTLSKVWPLLRGIILLLLLLIIGLDLTGYRYAAQSLTDSFALSLLVVLFAPPAYSIVTSTIKAIAQRQRRARIRTAGMEESAKLQNNSLGSVLRFIRLAFVLLVLVLLARFWGIDQNTFEILDEVHLYQVRMVGEIEEFVTGADCVRFCLYVAAMFWLLRSLPGIYEFAIFPRINLDQGAKYAILVLSRYGIFALGIFMALAEIHLDMGRLGWLMASLSVGLGFGLQDIVSNFVSGIILLVERPIQVNDVVTIGSVSGVVRRINIRATTIVNFDEQEVVLPNRNLITQEVTNWTRGNTVNRLVINIGVAYGSNVEEVSEILITIAHTDPDVLKEPPSSVIFMEHGDSSLNFALRVFLPSPALLMPTRDRLNKTINQKFAKQGIEIPFPQRDLHIKFDGEEQKQQFIASTKKLPTKHHAKETPTESGQ